MPYAGMKSKKDLKDVFSGASHLWYQGELDLTASTVTIQPEYDVPVKVDTLKMEMGDPNIEHYKVIGLPGDWVTEAEAGDMEIGFRVPTKHSDILKLAFGEDSVAAAAATVNTEASGTPSNFTGTKLVLSTHKVEGAWMIVNSKKDQILIIGNTALFAKPLLDSDAKGVFAVEFTGSLQSDGVTPDILFLKKNTAASSSSAE